MAMTFPSLTELTAYGVVLWLGFELLFYFVVMQDWRRGMDVKTPTPEYRMDPEVLIANVFNDLETLQDYSVIKFLEGWFLGASLPDVKRGALRLPGPLRPRGEKRHNDIGSSKNDNDPSGRVLHPLAPLTLAHAPPRFNIVYMRRKC